MTTTLTHITGSCLITGASHGIGKAIAHEWASKGVSIVAVAIDKQALLELKTDLEKMGRHNGDNIIPIEGAKKTS